LSSYFIEKKHIAAAILFSLKSCSLLFQRKKPENQPLILEQNQKDLFPRKHLMSL
jgi:hypothetical protein